jgi:hypothetical protein
MLTCNRPISIKIVAQPSLDGGAAALLFLLGASTLKSEKD